MNSGFRLTKRKIVLVVLINVVILVWTLFYLDRIPAEHVKTVTDGFRSLTKIEFNYLLSQPEVQDEKQYTGTKLTKEGYQLEKGNVQFKYLGNGGDTKQSPEDALRDNHHLYESTLKQEVKEPKDFDIESIRPPADLESYVRANATILSLVRDAEAGKIKKTIERLEAKFNSKFLYPYTFINDQPFTEKFKERMRKLSKAKMEFITISEKLWDKPEWIDHERESKAMQVMHDNNVAYAKLASYHNMCRFYLGNFYNVPELQQYKYYWRIEPNVNFYTDINYDIFKYMAGTKKKYGFTINLYDIDESIASLWPETLKFLNTGDNYKYVNPNGAFQWLLYDEQQPKKVEVAGGYSTCHFWSNFEIADMDFFRLEAYNEWFKHLDSTGKFYYERWGDAPVHSIGVALFADLKKDVHWFQDIGYFHEPYFHCPTSPLVDGCTPAKFSLYDNLNDQNCMGTWIKQYADKFEGVF